jgi:hypothetical protein
MTPLSRSPAKAAYPETEKFDARSLAAVEIEPINTHVSPARPEFAIEFIKSLPDGGGAPDDSVFAVVCAASAMFGRLLSNLAMLSTRSSMGEEEHRCERARSRHLRSGRKDRMLYLTTVKMFGVLRRASADSSLSFADNRCLEPTRPLAGGEPAQQFQPRRV